MKTCLYILFVFLAPQIAWGQQDHLTEANKALAAKDFSKAETAFRKASRGPESHKAAYGLSQCFLAQGRPDSALACLIRATRSPQAPDAYWFALGRLAQYQGDTTQAHQAFQHYQQRRPNDPLAQAYFKISKGMLPDSSSAQLKVFSFNAPQSDFGGSPFGENLVFASQRNNSKAGVRFTEAGSQAPLADLYLAEPIDSLRWKKSVRPFASGFNSRRHEGALWISPTKDEIYFTRTEKEGRESIYYARLEEENWSEPAPIALVDGKTNLAHPWGDPDAGMLYFASDRAGGLGGMDLYRVPFDHLSWEYVEHLGPEINGPGNEVYPVLIAPGKLHFASNSHPGQGGLDLFQATEHPNGPWSIRPFGPPINSHRNDFAFFLDPETGRGWLSSNRLPSEANKLQRSVRLADSRPLGADSRIIEPSTNPPDHLFQVYLEADPLPGFSDCEAILPFDYCYRFTDEITQGALPGGLFYEWDFGDGQKIQAIEARHCYAEPGTYRILLSVTDSLTGQPVFNQAEYLLEVERPYPLFISGPEATFTGPFTLSAGESRFPAEVQIDSYHWDIGSGFQTGTEDITLPVIASDSLLVRLGVRGTDPSGDLYQACVERSFFPGGLPKTLPTKPQNTPPIPNPEPLLTYRIQLGTSLKPIGRKASMYEKVPGTQEILAEGVYRYLAPDTLNLPQALQALDHYRSLGFQHPSVIREGSPEKRFERYWLPGDQAKEVTITGTIRDRNQEPVSGNIVWENLMTGEVVRETAVGQDGQYQEDLEKGLQYGYYIDLEGYYAISHALWLKDYRGDIVLEQDVELISVEDMIRERLPVRINNLFFDFDAAAIKPESYPELYRLVRFIQDHPELHFEIAGHTDQIGTEAYNQELSRQRARSVAVFLVLAGCDVDQISSRGAGETEPVASNATPEGRQANRRVEFRIRPIQSPALHPDAQSPPKQ